MSYGLTLDSGDAADQCRVWFNGLPMSVFDTFKQHKDLKVSFRYEKIPWLTAKDGQKWLPIRYMGPEGFFKRISFIDVLNSEKSLDKSLGLKKELGGKILLFGFTAKESKDGHTTEVGEMDGLEVNANIITTLMRALVEKQK